MRKLILAGIMLVGLMASPAMAVEYEYLVITCHVFATTDKAQTKKINKYAAEGWEFFFVSTVGENPMLYFRRPIN